MNITRKQISELEELTKKFKDQKETASELLRVAQDRFGHIKHKITRQGKEVELTEKILWEEVFYLNIDSEAGKILREKHPEVFEAYKIQDTMAIELQKFVLVNLGIDQTQMTISDYMKLSESLFEYFVWKKSKYIVMIAIIIYFVALFLPLII